MNKTDIIASTQQWLEAVVIGLQLCPFAKKPFAQKTIHYTVSEAKTDEERINELINECQILDSNTTIETSLIIFGDSLEDFFDYSQFITWANSTLKMNGWQGVYQIATFHPHYAFANTQTQDRENLTNRSPYPIVHILRESTLQRAIDNFPDTETIPDNNIATMNGLSDTDIKRLFNYLYKA